MERHWTAKPSGRPQRETSPKVPWGTGTNDVGIELARPLLYMMSTGHQKPA